MEASERCKELIRRHEGLRLEAYKCPGGVWTIGYGHTGGVKEGDRITEEQAERFLDADIARAEEAVERLAKSELSQNQFDALACFVFNVGEGAFAESTLLKLLNADPDDPRIIGEFMRWVHADGELLPGLINRRADEARLYFSGGRNA